MIPALPEVEAYAARILAGIDADALGQSAHHAFDRLRVGRDVEGLRDCKADRVGGSALWNTILDRHALRYWTDLTEVGSLYGQPWSQFHCDACGSDTHDALGCKP